MASSEQVGEWLNQGEGLVHSEDVPTHLNEEAAAVLNQKIDDHKSFFADLEHIREQGSTRTTTTTRFGIFPDLCIKITKPRKKAFPRCAILPLNLVQFHAT